MLPRRILNIAKSLIYGRKGISPSVERYLSEHGNEPIIQIIISRNVVNSIITGTSKVISPQFREMNGNNKFLGYSAKSNNCQNFILAILQSNNMANFQNLHFAKQSTQELFSTSLRKITNTITNIAAATDIIRQGGKV